MAPEDQKKFKILTYSEKDGASYQGNFKMEPNIYAYAELTIKGVKIKVVNDTEKPVATNFNSDQFMLHTKNNKDYVLKKGNVTSYPSRKFIKPFSPIEFDLQLPSDFWDTVGMKDHNTLDANYRNEFWTGLNQLRLLKEDINFISVSLGGETTIILKPVPDVK